MSKLYVFGCSFTWYGSTDLEDCKNNNLVHHKWYLEKSWPKLLSDSLGLEVVPLGRPGASNDEIYKKVIETSHLISKDDLVIVSWTEPSRKPINGSTHTLMPTIDTSSNRDFKNLLKFHLKYLYNEQLELSKTVTLSLGLDTLLPCKVLFSLFSHPTSFLQEIPVANDIVNSDIFLKSPSTGNSPLYDFKALPDKYQFKCLHPNASGHQFIASSIENILKKFAYPI